ncbi:MAG: helix-turn-helix transcriptional regulator [Candidatus Limivicinus sp.]
MAKKHALQFIRESQLSGYQHHSYALERPLSDFFLKGTGDSSLNDVLTLETYADILAPDRIRAMKNGLICFVTVTSRSAIDNGVDPERSFSLSDYYINEIEKCNTNPQLQNMVQEIIGGFRELLQDEDSSIYSFPVCHALRYVSSHIYGPCSVQDMAKAAGYNPQYFAVVFKKELGESPAVFIRRKKMEEARALLAQGNCQVSEIATSLGYCSASHFIREFKRFYGKTPKQYQISGLH